MATPIAKPILEPTEATWRRIEELLAEIAESGSHTSDRGVYLQNLLERLLEVLDAPGGIIWTADSPQEPQIGASAHRIAEPPWLNEGLNVHRRLADNAILGKHPNTVFPGRKTPPESSAHESSRRAVVLQPILSTGECYGVIEIICPAEWPESSRQLALEVLEPIAELCADFERRRRLHELAERESVTQQLDALLRSLYASLNLDEVAYLLANEGRQFLECDRVTVLIARGRRLRTVSVSGVAVADCRADLLRRLESLCDAASSGTEPLIAFGAGGQPAVPLPEQLSVPLQAYLNVSPVRWLMILPLRLPGDHSKGASLGALVLEQFSSDPPVEIERRAVVLAPHASLVLRNALFVSQIPFGRRLLAQFSAARGPARRRRWIVTAFLAAALATMCLVPSEFTVTARGELQPQLWQDVFAPEDGTVDELLVNENDAVVRGQPLVTLRNPGLELELKRVLGELQSSRERLAAIRTARIEGNSGDPMPTGSMSRLSGEEAEVTAQLASLERQLSLLNSQQADLIVRSPLTGRVLTWDVEHLLRGRPVKRGQALLTVADVDGPWQVELRLPDKYAGHVLAARQALGPELAVDYILATDPGHRHSSRIATMALATESDEQNEPAVLVTAAVAPGGMLQPRPRSAVTARIHCGRRSLAYVWLHDAIDSFRRILFF